MHATADLRNLKCLDGLYYSFELLNNAYTNLYKDCSLIIKQQENLVSALSRCWTFIDCVHRVREISQAIPGLNQNKAELKVFLQQTKIAEICRHYIQHLRNNLSKKDIDPYPVWGTLSWIDPNDNSVSYTAIIGSQVPNMQIYGCVYDTLEKKWVSKVSLSVKEKAFHFDPIYQIIAKFKDFIIPWIISNYKPGIKVMQKIPIISAKVVIK